LPLSVKLGTYLFEVRDSRNDFPTIFQLSCKMILGIGEKRRSKKLICTPDIVPESF